MIVTLMTISAYGILISLLALFLSAIFYAITQWEFFDDLCELSALFFKLSVVLFILFTIMKVCLHLGGIII